MRTHFRTAAAGAALLMFGATAAAAQPKSFAFDEPAGPLSKAVRDVAVRTGRNIIAPEELLKSRQAPPLSGNLTAEEAIGKLLEGTGLGYKLVDGTLVIEPVPFAEASVAEEAAPDIVVTGTHVRSAPPTSPVIMIGRKQIDESGVASVEELMKRLPQNLSAGVDQENFAVQGTGSDITQHGAGINLRGLGQRATLVLVNGRKLAPSDTGSFVDVSLIPITAIERIEVLTDGASAIYGSDAVAGVVNFVLRKDFSGVEPVVQAGVATGGGGRQLLAGLTAGRSWAGGRALLSYEYRDEAPVLARDRDFTIGLPADWNLLPSEKRHSLYGTARQDLRANLSVDLSAIYAARDTQRTFFDATQVAIGGDASARSFGGTAAIRFRPSGSWLAEASAGYYRSRTREQQIQAGALFNRSNTSNDYREFAVKADGKLVDLPAGSLKLALGAGTRRETFESLFATRVNAPTLVDASRTVSSAFGELNLPIFGKANRQPGLEQLTLSAAGRFERYERIGSTFNPKFGLLWSPTAGLAFRGSYGTSFRAPLLSESFGYYNLFLFPVGILYRDPSLATPGVGAALVGSDPDVKPERSKSLSVGIDIAPPSLRRLRLSANYYKIDFTNRIALPSQQINLIGDPAFAPVVTLDPSAASVADLMSGANQTLDFSGPGFTDGGATAADIVAVVDARVSNTAETRTSGLDLLLDYGFGLGQNQFGVQLNANKVFRFDDKLTSASPWIRTLATPYHPVDWRLRAGLSWRRGALSAATFLNYASPYRDNRAPAVRRVDSLATIDASIALDGAATKLGWLSRSRLALSVQNLLDTPPPRLLPEPGSTRGIGYDPVNASGRGRIIALQLRGTW